MPIVHARSSARLVAAAACLWIGVGGALAQTTTLQFTMGGVAASNPVVAELYVPWAKEVSEASGGEFRIEVVPGLTLAGPRNFYERVASGVVDIGWGVHGAVGLPFEKTQVVSLPFLVNSISNGSVALWRLHASGLIADEYKGVRVLGLLSFPAQGIHAKKKIASLADLKGMKIRAADRISAEIVSALGASPISIPATEVYQGLSRGVADGLLGGWTLVETFRLYEVVDKHLEGSLGTPPAMVVMNPQAYEKLSPKARQVLDRYAGEALSRRIGQWFLKNSTEGAQKVAAMAGHDVYALSPEEREKWRQAAEVVVRQWVARTAGGDKVLAAVRSELQKLGD